MILFGTLLTSYHFRIHIVYDILDKNRSNQLITCSIFLAYVFWIVVPVTRTICAHYRVFGSMVVFDERKR